MAKAPSSAADYILEAMENISADIRGHDFESFRKDRRARQLVERNLEIASEASRRISDEFKRSEPGVPWKDLAGIGNILRHRYHEIRVEAIWKTCTEDLESLKNAAKRMRKTFERGGNRDIQN